MSVGTPDATVEVREHIEKVAKAERELYESEQRLRISGITVESLRELDEALARTVESYTDDPRTDKRKHPTR